MRIRIGRILTPPSDRVLVRAGAFHRAAILVGTLLYFGLGLVLYFGAGYHFALPLIVGAYILGYSAHSAMRMPGPK
jgi:hypothetical protein